MAEDPSAARSPIAPAPPWAVVSGWVVSARSTTSALRLSDQTPLSKVTVRASPDGPLADQLGVPLGRARHLGLSGDDVLAVASGPGEWLVLSAPGQQGPLVAHMEAVASGAHELVTVIDVTHGRALVRLTGARSPDLLAMECALDLLEAAFPHGRVLRSAVSGVATELVRDDRDGERSYLLVCERHFGQYLYDCLLESGAEFGAEPDGFVSRAGWCPGPGPGIRRRCRFVSSADFAATSRTAPEIDLAAFGRDQDAAYDEDTVDPYAR